MQPSVGHRIVDAADFDGTNDRMARGADLSGVVDGKSGIFSCWYRVDGGDGTQRELFLNVGAQFRVEHTTGNLIMIRGTNAAVAEILNMRTSAKTASASWLHILASWDLATAGSGRLYVNDVSDKNEVTYTNDTIKYTTGDWGVGGLTVGAGSDTNGCLAEMYFAPGQYMDFSNVFYRRKFISSSGKPVHLGTNGALPNGTAPLVYLHLDDGEAVANFATNRGTGGNFTITGTLDTGSSSPSD